MTTRYRITPQGSRTLDALERQRSADAWVCACGARFASSSAASSHTTAQPWQPSKGMSASHRIVSRPL